MTDKAPDDIRELAQARSAARETLDWAEADRLRAEIELAGWKVVDRGTRFQLLPATPADVVEVDRTRYGSSRSVPSRLGEPPSNDATVIVAVSDGPDDFNRLLEALRRTAPPRTQVVIVADAPSGDMAGALEAADGPATGPIGREPPEVVWTAHRLGPAGAANAGIRRAVGEVVVLLDPIVEPTGDLVTPLVRALDDPSVAVVGPWGSVSTDLRRWIEAPPGEVDIVDGRAMAFRRDDYISRGPLDEAFRTPGHLATWWSLVLRDEGEDKPARRALRLAEPQAVRHERSADPGARSADAVRKAKRDFYRIIDRFGRRRDLLLASQPA